MNSTDTSPPPDGSITTERIGRLLAIGIDRPKKLNGFSPRMLVELAEAFTALEGDAEAWVGLLFAHGANFTAGLELDKVAPLIGAVLLPAAIALALLAVSPALGLAALAGVAVALGGTDAPNS